MSSGHKLHGRHNMKAIPSGIELAPSRGNNLDAVLDGYELAILATKDNEEKS